MRTRRWAVLLLAGLVGCGPVDGALTPPEAPEETRAEALGSANGLSLNGLSLNGLSLNGLSLNGLSLNGLSTSQFHTWFQADPALGDMVMRYVVRCAVPAGQERRYTDPRTGTAYAWPGGLGLAPDWAQGARPTLAEQQVVSACLAAHANKYGLQMSISVLGRDARGRAIPSSYSELSTFSEREACFFGNLFTGEGLYVGSDYGLLSGNKSSLRACALSPGPLRMEEACQPMEPVGNCELLCTKDLSLTHYTSCTYRGVTYRPLTTRLQPRDVYRCGDGICQSTEACGVGLRYEGCTLDCGVCP